MSDEFPVFDLPHDTILAGQFWLNALAWTANPILLGAVRAHRVGEQGLVAASVTHYLPRDRPGEDALDRVMFDWPRHHGRAGDLIGSVLGAAEQRRHDPPLHRLFAQGAVEILVGMARRAPGWTDDERAVLEQVERELADSPTGGTQGP